MLRKNSIIIAIIVYIILLYGCNKTNEQLDITDFENLKLGMSVEEIKKKYGEPDEMLSGFYGNMYLLENDTRVILYFDQDSKLVRLRHGSAKNGFVNILGNDNSDNSTTMNNTTTDTTTDTTVDNTTTTDNTIDDSVIAKGEINYADDITYHVILSQSRYEKPLTPEDEGFSMYYSAYYGAFDIIITDKQNVETDRVSLNSYFNEENIGFIGRFDLRIEDYNFDNYLDFGIGQIKRFLDCGVFGYVVFSVNENGEIIHLPVENGFLYNSGDAASLECFINKEENYIRVGLPKEEGSGYKFYWYIWEKGCFTLKK